MQRRACGGAEAKDCEYNINKTYTKLTWLDFDRLEPREAVEIRTGKALSSSTSSSPESPASSNIPSDSDVGGREASELDRLRFLVAISMSLSLSNNEAASRSATWGS
jgi:hypothetical protein